MGLGQNLLNTPTLLSGAYAGVVGATDAIRWVGPNGSDSNNGRSWGNPFATVAHADSDLGSNGVSNGVIVLLPGTVPMPVATPSHAIAILGTGGESTLSVPAGATGTALTMGTAGFVLEGFTLDCSACSGTITNGIAANAANGMIDGVKVTGAPTPITGSNCGSLRIGTKTLVQLYNPTGYGIDLNGDGGMEVTIDQAVINRSSAGSFTGGIRVSRTTSTDTGGLYLGRVNVTQGAGTYTYGLNVTSSAANTNMPVRISPVAVFDGAGTNAVHLNNIENVSATGGWFTTLTGSGQYAVAVTGGGQVSFVGGTVQGDTSTGGAFDLSGGTTNPSIFNCVMGGGTLIKVASGTPPTGIKYSGNRGYATLTNDATTLAGAVNLTDASGLMVQTSASLGGGVFALHGVEANSNVFLRVMSDGSLEFVANDFATVMARLYQTGDFQGNGSFWGIRGSTAIAKPTVTGSKGANAALASLLTALANQGLVTDSTT